MSFQHAYLFIPGRTPLLTLHELYSMLPDASIRDLGAAYLVTVPDQLSEESLINELGGTVKIARVVGRTANITGSELITYLTPETPGLRITFGISWYGMQSKDEYLHEIKDGLAASGIVSRYVTGHGNEPLSSVVIAKDRVTELIIVRDNDDFIIGRTRAVQDFEQWGERDMGRRFADARAGMLPIKVSRMVVNIALGKNARGKSLLDPFCGMGTIVNEAAMRGAYGRGSDVSGIAIEKAKQNVRSIEDKVPSGTHLPEFFVADATHVSEYIAPSSIDAVVTEPYMGPTSLGDSKKAVNFSAEKIKNVLKGLGKLYIGSLNEWRKILKPGGIVIIAIPVYSIGGRMFSVKNTVDRCENLGYTRLVGPIEYSRPLATVRRNFYILRLAENKK